MEILAPRAIADSSWLDFKQGSSSEKELRYMKEDWSL